MTKDTEAVQKTELNQAISVWNWV